MRDVLEPVGYRGADRPIDRAYWLTHCEGYSVDTGTGHLGFVETVIVGENPPDDTCLAVRAGWLGRKVVLVPLSSVAFIVPRAERIWLRASDCS